VRVAQHAGADLPRDRTQGVGISGPVVDHDHAAQVRREGGQQPGDGAGPVLDRDDDGHLLRPGPVGVRDGVHDAAVNQASGQGA
jgi:hypothetical protein